MLRVEVVLNVDEVAMQSLSMVAGHNLNVEKWKNKFSGLWIVHFGNVHIG